MEYHDNFLRHEIKTEIRCFSQTLGISKTVAILYKVIGNCQFIVSSNILIRNEISETLLVAM